MRVDVRVAWVSCKGTCQDARAMGANIASSMYMLHSARTICSLCSVCTLLRLLSLGRPAQQPSTYSLSRPISLLLSVASPVERGSKRQHEGRLRLSAPKAFASTGGLPPQQVRSNGCPLRVRALRCVSRDFWTVPLSPGCPGCHMSSVLPLPGPQGR